MRVLATAGHVDHGKSTIVRALTGVDPDRWAEEKARGMTIDLGFAATTLPSGQEISFVDVPGHERLVKNMLAGVGSVSACLFVVAATEGWKPQSEEHLRILQLMGARRGIVALTKVALTEPGWPELVALDVRDRLAGTFLETAEVVEVDIPAGIGLDDLRDALGRLVRDVPPAVDAGRPRLWIDRCFSVRGSGTVVTGTLTGGRIAVGDEMAVEPGGHPVRVRALESHHIPMDSATPGRRLAVNISGVSADMAGRGHALVRPGQWHLATTFDAGLTVLAALDHPVGRRGAYVVHTGSGEFPVRLRVLESDRIEPGQDGAVRFWSRRSHGVPLVPGDRYVLREAGRFETVGGGEILDVEPVLPASRARPSRSAARVVRERGWVDAGHLARLTGEPVEPTIGRWVVDPRLLAEARTGIEERCRAGGVTGVAMAGFGERDRALLEAGVPGVVVRDGRAVHVDVADQGLDDNARRVLSALEAGKWSPPDLPLSDRGALRELQRRGLAIEANSTWFASSAVDAAAALLSGLLQSRPDGFTVGEARDVLGSTRKHVVPLLSYLDSAGITRRRGDLRVAGPRRHDGVGRRMPR